MFAHLRRREFPDLPVPDGLSFEVQNRHRKVEGKQNDGQTSKCNGVSTVHVPRVYGVHETKGRQIFQAVQNDKGGVGSFQVAVGDVGVCDIAGDDGAKAHEEFAKNGKHPVHPILHAASEHDKSGRSRDGRDQQHRQSHFRNKHSPKSFSFPFDVLQDASILEKRGHECS